MKNIRLNLAVAYVFASVICFGIGWNALGVGFIIGTITTLIRSAKDD